MRGFSVTTTNIIVKYPQFPSGCPCLTGANSTNPFQTAACKGAVRAGLQTTMFFPQRQFWNQTVRNCFFQKSKTVKWTRVFTDTTYIIIYHLPSSLKRIEIQVLVRGRQERSCRCQLKHARYPEEDKRSGNTREEEPSLKGWAEVRENKKGEKLRPWSRIACVHTRT